MKTLDDIKQLMAAGETVQAEEALKELLAKEPDNLQAKMLYGTCRQLLGDEETFKRIHDELAPMMERLCEQETPTDSVSTWNKYHRTFLELASDGLAKETDREEIRTLYGCFDYDEGRTRPMNLYRSPSMAEIETIRKMLDDKRRRKIIGRLLFLIVLFMFLLAWWLGQKL